MKLFAAWKALKSRFGLGSISELGSPAAQVVGLLILAAYFLDLIWPWYKDNLQAVVPLATGIGGGIALWVAFRQMQTARLRHEEQTKADIQRRITETFSKATENLGSDKLEVRLGGIYTLERILNEVDPRDYWTVIETLTAFIRERARWKAPSGTEESDPDEEYDEDNEEEYFYGLLPKCPTDVQAVMTVIGRRSEKGRQQELSMGWTLELPRADLRGANLENAHLNKALLLFAHLENANLQGAHLEETKLKGAHLDHANLENAYLERADFLYARLEGAYLNEAHMKRAKLQGALLVGALLIRTDLEEAVLHEAQLQEATLRGAHLQQANLYDAHLEGAFLSDAYLQGADLRGAHLEGAKLDGAHLSGAKLARANLSGAKGLEGSQIASADGDESTILPDGVKRPAHWPQQRSRIESRE